MIDYLRHMAIFAQVVDDGSFRAASQSLGLAPSRVSEMVSELEDRLGVTLLYRTTRKSALTSEGRIFYARVVEMLRSAEAGLDDLNALALDPVGTLRISIPAFMASGPLTTAVAAFARSNPNVSFSVTYTDHRVRLVEDGYDLAIRVGWLQDSSMMSRKLGEGQRVLVAGADYARDRPVPEAPADLEDWNWIRFSHRPETTELISPQGETETVTGTSQIEADNIESVFYYARNNMGATVLPSFLATRGIADGSLVPLLPTWKLQPLGIYVVWSDKSRRESLSLLFVRFLAEQELC